MKTIEAMRPVPQPIPEYIDIAVPVLRSTLCDAWSRREHFMDEGIVREFWYDKGRTEEELQLLLGVFWAAADALPMLTTDYVNWLLDYGCANTVRERVEAHFVEER